MKFLNRIAAIGMMTALSLNAAADEPTIIINSRAESAAPQIVVRSIYDFEQSISLKLKTDPKLGVSDVLIRTISKLGMVDARGVKITSGFDIDLDNNLVVAFSGGTSEIIKASGNPNALNIIANFKDANGNFVSPPKDSLAVYNLQGEKLCFTYETIQKSANKMAFALLLDKSGSMFSVLDDVKAVANQFLTILPKNAECAVASFDTQFEYTTKYYQPCGGIGFDIDGIKIGGGTDIYLPLKSTYQDLSNPNFENHQKAVIIITDGYTIADPARKAELLKLKGNAFTFVYFIGGQNKNELEDLTDHFIAQGGDIKQSLSQYFGSIGQAYNTQKVLSIKRCAGAGYGTP